MKIRIPAEWEEQEALIVVFPPKQSDWAHSIEEIHQTYLTFITTIARFQKCMVICEDKKALANLLPTLQNIELIQMPTNDTWIRDLGVSISIKIINAVPMTSSLMHGVISSRQTLITVSHDNCLKKVIWKENSKVLILYLRVEVSIVMVMVLCFQQRIVCMNKTATLTSLKRKSDKHSSIFLDSKNLSCLSMEHLWAMIQTLTSIHWLALSIKTPLPM